MISQISKLLLSTAGAAVLAAALAPSAAQAHGNRNPPVVNRYRKQQARINQGVKNGQLTPGEYRNDESHLLRGRAIYDRDRQQNGGPITAKQNRNLNRRADVNSSRIFYTKHNTHSQTH